MTLNLISDRYAQFTLQQRPRAHRSSAVNESVNWSGDSYAVWAESFYVATGIEYKLNGSITIHFHESNYEPVLHIMRKANRGYTYHTEKDISNFFLLLTTFLCIIAMLSNMDVRCIPTFFRHQKPATIYTQSVNNSIIVDPKRQTPGVVPLCCGCLSSGKATERDLACRETTTYAQ